MPETLLTVSEILLFGRRLEDIEVANPPCEHSATVVATRNIRNMSGHRVIDEVELDNEDIVLLTDQDDRSQNGLWIVSNDGEPWTCHPNAPAIGQRIFVADGEQRASSTWQCLSADAEGAQFERVRGLGNNNFLDVQFRNACIARIYAFAWEGTYYELPSPTLFLVEGDGRSATNNDMPGGPGNLASRAPNSPDLSGVAAADFQIADDIRVWAYDKADYTVRFDVSTGMFEQLLLDTYFGTDAEMMAGAKVSGAKVSGAKVSGAKVSGAKVSGAKVSGAKVSGAKVYGPGD